MSHSAIAPLQEKARVALKARLTLLVASHQPGLPADLPEQGIGYLQAGVLREYLVSTKTLSMAQRSELWDAIDAIGFYLDATGDQWRYMNDETRERYLNWVLAFAQTAGIQNAA